MSKKLETQIKGDWINEILRSAAHMTDDGDAQLSILARALVIGCKSCGVSKDTAMEIVESLFDEETKIVPLLQTTN